jgi:hypothetical protein
MKTLSLLQPWATLWALGLKTHETRSWPTNHRGPLYIHASKGKDPAGRLLYQRAATLGRWGGPTLAFQDLRDAFSKGQLPQSFHDLPFGAIIGQVNITDVIPIDLAFQTHIATTDITDYTFGNYTPGRFAWKATAGELFKSPIPAKGHLGLWQYNP